MQLKTLFFSKAPVLGDTSFSVVGLLRRTLKYADIALLLAASSSLQLGPYIFTGGALADAAPQDIIITGHELAKEHEASWIHVLEVTPLEHSLENILKSQKGLVVRSLSGPGSLTSVNIRGLGAGRPEHILVLLDGIRLNSAQGNGVNLAHIPVSSIEKIEILKGSESALYGSEAIGGVMNIVTRTPKENKNQLQWQLTQNGDHFLEAKDHKLSFQFQKNDDNQNWFFSMFKEKNPGDYAFKNPLTGNVEKRTHNEYGAFGALIKKTWGAASNWKITTLHEFSNAQKGVPGPIHFPSTDQQSDFRWISDLHIFRTLIDGTQLSLRTPLRWTRQIYDTNSAQTIHKNLFLNPKTTLVLPIHEKHLLTTHLEMGWDRINSDALEKHQTRSTFAATFKDDFYVTDKYLSTPALRLETSPGAYAVIIPKLSTTYKASETLALKSNFGLGFRAPSFNELYWQDAYFQGNETLRPEKSIETNIGWQWNAQLFQVENALFFTKLSDLIATEQVGPSLWAPRNIENTQIWGTDFLVKAPFLKYFSGNINYTWLNHKLHYRSTHSLNTALEIKIPVISAEVTQQWLSPQTTGDTSRPKLNHLSSTDLKATIDFNANLSLQAQVNNIFDQSLEQIAYYPLPGRTFQLSISSQL